MSPPVSRKENLTPKSSPNSCKSTTTNWQVCSVCSHIVKVEKHDRCHPSFHHNSSSDVNAIIILG